MSKSVKRRTATRRRTDSLSMGPRDPLGFCRALWRRAYPERRSHDGGSIRGRGRKRRRRQRRGAPARLGGNARLAKSGPTFNRPGYPELLSPAALFCSNNLALSSLHLNVFTGDDKVDDCHLTILLASSQYRFELVASFEEV